MVSKNKKQSFNGINGLKNKWNVLSHKGRVRCLIKERKKLVSCKLDEEKRNIINKNKKVWGKKLEVRVTSSLQLHHHQEVEVEVEEGYISLVVIKLAIAVVVWLLLVLVLGVSWIRSLAGRPSWVLLWSVIIG